MGDTPSVVNGLHQLAEARRTLLDKASKTECQLAAKRLRVDAELLTIKQLHAIENFGLYQEASELLRGSGHESACLEASRKTEVDSSALSCPQEQDESSRGKT